MTTLHDITLRQYFDRYGDHINELPGWGIGEDSVGRLCLLSPGTSIEELHRDTDEGPLTVWELLDESTKDDIQEQAIAQLERDEERQIQAYEPGFTFGRGQ